MKADPPTVSVVMIVRNEETHILPCLQQIGLQDYPRDRMEIIVADGMSTDRTRELVESFRSDIPLRMILNPAGRRAHGLNLAVRAARGQIVARVDARTVIRPDYLSSCVQVLQLTGADNVGGVQRVVGGTPTQEAIALAMSHPFGVGNAQFRIGRRSGYVDTVYPGCFRRDVFDRVGYFDDQAAVISEDSDLNYRISRSGGRVYLDTGIVVFYRARESFADLWRLYFRYGGARAGTLLKHRRLFSLRQLVPPVFMVGLLILGALAFARQAWLVAFCTAVGVYVLTVTSVAGALAFPHRKPHLFGWLLVAFPAMHFAWAMGFWRRLLQRPAPGTYWSH